MPESPDLDILAPRKPTGLILAGGRSSRMGGGDKCLIPLAGKPLLSLALDVIAPQCAAVWISANGDRSRFRRFGCEVICDATAVFEGPLAGLLAGLDRMTRMSASDDTWLLTVPGDTPFLPADLAERLIEAACGRAAPSAHAVSGDRAHPVVAVWAPSLVPRIADAFAAGVRSVRHLQRLLGSATASWPAEPIDPFLNINTPEDLARAEDVIRSRGP